MSSSSDPNGPRDPRAGFRTVLVPLDFSEHSAHALRLAIALARGSGATLHLVHAYEVPLGAIPPYGVAIPETLLAQVRDAAARRLEKASHEVDDAGLPCEIHVVQGPAADAIVEETKRLAADLIVMGTRGHTGLKHVLLGSVAERTVRMAPCPVLTARLPSRSEEPAGPFRRILVPLDFSKHAEAALALAIDLAKQSGAEIHLVHAYELPTAVTMAYGVAIPQSVWDGVQEAAQARLDEGRKKVAEAGVKVSTHVASGPAADAIAHAAETFGADLIVMGTRGLTGLKHVLLGSVAERTIRTAPCPVLTVKADAGES